MLQMKLVDKGKFKLEEVPTPQPREGEVLLEIRRAGICGSDLHIYRGENPVIQAPVILGHEAVGIVAEIGSGVKSFKVGQRVVIIPYVACGKCIYCQNGHPNLCENLVTIGGTTENGAFSQYLVVPEHCIVHIPAEINLEQAVLIEPTTVAVHAVKRNQNLSGKNVAILGAGTIGLLVLQVAKIYGVEKVLITDMVEEKLELAAKLGADLTVNVSNKDCLELLRDEKKFGRFDIVFDCVVNAATIKLAFELVKRTQKVVAVGIPTGEVAVSFIHLICNELSLLGSYLYLKQDFLEARDLIEERKVNVSSLISKEFPFADIARAFQEIEQSKGKLVKAILNMEK